VRPDDGNETTGPRDPRPAEPPEDLRLAHEELAAARRDVLDELTRAQRDLAAARREIERSHEELERLARVASHDLRAPLRAVKGFADLLQRRYGDRLDAEGGEFVGFIRDAAQRMDGVIVATVELARTSAAPLAAAPVDLDRLLAAALATLPADADVESGALPTVRGDAAQLGRLIEHLLANAVAFRAERPLRIVLDADTGRDEVVLRVADNGIGIAPSDRERVFDAFARLNPTDDDRAAGIGLAVCRTIAERHGGRIWIEDSPLGGIAVRVALPPA
jgi:signal transduction histidine kinase